MFQLCSAASSSLTLQQDLFLEAFPASSAGPSIVTGLPFTVYSFNGLNTVPNNWLVLSDSIKRRFLQTTDQFTVSFWLRVEPSSDDSYILTFEVDRSRYFSLYESSQARLIFYYFRDPIPGFSAADDDADNTQVALSFYYNRTQLPTGLRDNQWHFIALNVAYPSVTLLVDGVQYQPTRGNYRDQFDSRVLLNQVDGVNYTMPAPILVKSESQIADIAGRIGGSARGTSHTLFGEMRQLVLSDLISEDLYACLASCNNLIGVDPSQSFPNIRTFYNPVTRVFDFTGPTNAARYTTFLQYLIYYTNGFLPPEESRESRRITLRINDELGLGSPAQVNLIGRSNQDDPLLDANGDLVDGIDFTVDLIEDLVEVQELQILSPRSFITDTDIDSRIVSVTVNLTNPVNGNEETIRLLDTPPSLVNITNANGVVLGAGSSSQVIFIESIDPLRSTANVFITALLNLRYINSAEEPLDVDRIIEFTVFDGLRTNNPRARTIIDISITNDVPVIDLNGAGPGFNQIANYVESSPPTALAPDLSISDPDSIQLTAATARIERVFDEGNETIAIDMSMLIPDLSCDPCNGTSISITGAASQPVYQRLLRSLHYVNLKQLVDLPNLRDRTVFVTVSDGVSSSDPGANIIIDFIPLNPRVIVELAAPLQNYSVNLTEGQAEPILCHSLVRVVDTSIDTLESIVVSIRDVLPEGITENEEMISLTSTDDLSISIEINTALKRITFSQVSDISQYLEAIRRVQYFNGEPEPYLVSRFVDFLVIPGGGAPSDTAECGITILSVNDNTPECPAVDPISLLENSNVGSLIHTLEATDLDRGRDGELSYRLVHGDASLFAVSVSGEVTLSGGLDREATPEHLLTAQACDNGSPSHCCEFNITIVVQDVNDNPPIFNSMSYFSAINENEVRNFLTISDISDADEGTNALLSSVQIDPDSFSVRAGCFGRFLVQVNSNNEIVLSTASPGLDFEVARECIFEIIANDAGNPPMSGRATVNVTVLDQDDFPPEFIMDPYNFTVVERNSFPQVIGRVVATDRDSPALNYSLIGGIGSFEIDTNSGNVSILFSSDHEEQSEYTFTAQVTDPGNRRDTAMVTVLVLAINENPPVLDLNITDGIDLQDALTPFVFVEEGDPVRLSVEPNVTDPDDVAFMITRITVRVANSGNPASEVLFLPASSDVLTYTILPSSTPTTLTIQPHNPTSISDIHTILQSLYYDNTEDELSECDSTLHPCRYGPLSRTLLYSVFDGMFYSNDSSAFIVFEEVNDPPSVNLDLDDGPGFSTEFREGSDGVAIVNPASYSIMDEDSVNLLSLTCNLTNPLDSAEETLSLRPNLPLGLTATINTPHVLQIEGNAPISDFEAALGLVVYRSTSDNPDTTVRQIEVYVTDDGMLQSNVAIATITFNATNDPPRLDLDSGTPGTGYTATFTENGPPIPLSASPAVRDVDSNNLQSLTVTIVGDTGPEEVLTLDQSLITTNSLSYSYIYPQLTVTGLADLDTYEAIIASVRYQNTADEIAIITNRIAEFSITDAEGGVGSASTVIRIMTLDDNPPMFIPTRDYTFTINENVPLNTLVGVVTIIDADLPPELTTPVFTILSATPFSDFVIVNNPLNPMQGQISVSGSIDYDARAQRYSLMVEVQSASRNANASITINVVNLPDVPPVFNQCPPPYSVFENEPFNTPLTPSSCTAVDPDGLDPIRYTIEGNVIQDSTLITIDENTGILTVVDNIDREMVGTEISVVITAGDSTQNTSRRVPVIILGQNEHDPSFSQPSYVVAFEENLPPSTQPILQVIATDLDESPDLRANPDFVTRITYTIESIDPVTSEQYFSINSTTGEIQQLLPIDYEEITMFQLTVVANDNDATVTPRRTPVLVRVNVININDEAPSFVALPDRIIVRETTPVSGIVTVIATTDPDINAFLSVSILPPVPSQFFLTAVSGILSVLQPLDAEVPPREFNITLQLADTNTDPQYLVAASVFANTTIVIQDENDEIPTFGMPMYSGDVTENSAAGTTVLTVSAQDRDYGFDPDGNLNGNSELSYFFSAQDSPPANTFQINRLTGDITTASRLNREDAASYEFTVVVQDGGIPARVDTARVRIEVRDINEFPPVADPDIYFSFVSESAPVGEQIATYAQVAWNISRKY